jgi:hypothetical protein
MGGDADLYRYVGDDPIDNIDPSGLAFRRNCPGALVNLARAIAKLAERLAENKGKECDPGHDKAIQQAASRVRKALNSAITQCSPTMKELEELIQDAGEVLEEVPK